ncbi:MAG: hypothetical protein FWE36_04660 [Erysipelotrichales bacterium]|nr:hypothetical protein [Erysipelotrichales bacterium]
MTEAYDSVILSYRELVMVSNWSRLLPEARDTISKMLAADRNFLMHSEFYGNFQGFYALLVIVLTDMRPWVREVVAGFEFWYVSQATRIWIIDIDSQEKHTLTEAYDSGMITFADVQSIYESHAPLFHF